MRSFKKHFLILWLFCVIFSYAQKTEFVVPQKMENLENKISNFNNEYTSNFSGMSGAAAPDGSEFITTINLDDMKFEAKTNPYLILGLNKGAKARQFIQRATWTVTLKKQTKNSTKVSVALAEITLDQWSKKEVNTKTTKSTGKLEAEVKSFLMDKSTNQSKNFAEYNSGEVSDSAMVAVEDAAFDAMIAAGDAQRNKKTIISKQLQKLFGKDFISIPTQASVFTKALNINPTEIPCEDCKDGLYYNWDFEDFNLIYAKTTDGQEYYSIKYFGDDKVNGLPYDLVFNDSSSGGSKTKFARFNSQLYQTTVNIDENSDRALLVVDFKKDKNFVRLEFGNEYLTRIIVSNKEIH